MCDPQLPAVRIAANDKVRLDDYCAVTDRTRKAAVSRAIKLMLRTDKEYQAARGGDENCQGPATSAA